MSVQLRILVLVLLFLSMRPKVLRLVARPSLLVKIDQVKFPGSTLFGFFLPLFPLLTIFSFCT